MGIIWQIFGHIWPIYGNCVGGKSSGMKLIWDSYLAKVRLWEMYGKAS